jgi:putative acetyltransferase
VTTPAATLRPMLPADIPVLAAIFQASIEELAAEDYDEGQRAAWAGAADDEAAFGAGLQNNLTLVAVLQGAPVGFASLEGKDNLRMLYVYPPVARQGVGALLADAIEKMAGARGAKRLEVDASDTARPFFEARGYEAQHRQTVEIGGEWLGNTHMVKTLG